MSNTRKTCLYDRHTNAGAKIVEFGGWLMPVQYAGVLKEHEAVRQRAGLFDVSHMGEIFVTGPDARAFVNRVVTNDVSSVEEGKAVYTLLCNGEGGILDDLLVYCLDEREFMLVVNASNTDKDFEWIASQIKGENLEVINRSAEYALLALQGPMAERIFKKVGKLPASLDYYSLCRTSIGDADAIVSRTGYTGEDGLEIYLETAKAGAVWDALLEAGKEEGIMPTGLAARDLLRIEAGYPLYGHELDETINPVSAGLSWAVKMDGPDFIGKPALEGFKPEKKRIGFQMDSRKIPRQSYPILVNGEKVGVVTSGTYSPVLQKPIGIGYIPRVSGGAKNPVALAVEIRGKEVPATVCRMPFVKLGIIRRGHGAS